MNLKSFAIAAVLVLGLSLSAFAAKLGDPAGALVIKEWVKGQPVNVTDGKAVYVVEFWATWCPPCRTSIPHLTEMQKKFKDKGVVFIGVSDEPVDKVKPFVTDMGEKMDYIVACDDARKTNAAYMQAFGQGGIPHAFIVGKDGKVVWHGHPMSGLDKTLGQILDGSYDLAKAIKADEGRAAMDEYQKLALKGDAKAKEVGEKVMAGLGEDIDALTGFAFNIAANGRVKNRDFALADKALDKAEKAAGGKDARVLAMRGIVRFEAGQHEEGIALEKEAAQLAKDEPTRKRYEGFTAIMERRKGQNKK